MSVEVMPVFVTAISWAGCLVYIALDMVLLLPHWGCRVDARDVCCARLALCCVIIILHPCAYEQGFFFALIVYILVLSCLLRATGVSVGATCVS